MKFITIYTKKSLSYVLVRKTPAVIHLDCQIHNSKSLTLLATLEISALIAITAQLNHAIKTPVGMVENKTKPVRISMAAARPGF